VFGALTIGLLAGCGPKGGGAKSTQSDNVFRYALTTAPTTFDPALVEDGPTIDVLQNIYEGLVQWTSENKLAPCLAEKWDVSKDGLTYTFHIRPNVKFQDGNPVTAQDVYYSFHRALDPKVASPIVLTYMGDIVGAEQLRDGKATELTGVKVIDPMTVAVTISKPKAYWIYTLTYPTSYIVSKAEGDKVQGPITDVETAAGAGTGPFKLDKYEKDSRVVLTANAGYWGGAPKIAGIERPIVTDAGTRHSLYLSGKLDIVDEQQGDLAQDEQDPTVKNQVKYWSRAATFYLGLNQKAFPAFKDVRVRQAMAYATDKQKLRHVVMQDQLDLAEDILPEGIPGFDPSFKGIPYDPKKAQDLLAAAGYPGGKGFPTVTISYRESFPDLAKTVDMIRQMWKDNLGINVEARQMEWGALIAQEDNNALECYHIRWSADYLDPQDYYSILLRTGSAEDHTGYSNPKYDALCDQADVLQDFNQRNALYRQAARIAADEVPLIPLYYEKDIELIKPRVQNIDDSLMGHLPHKRLTLAQ
jgi:ABC-type transport system substrate-binding protein